MLNIEEKMRVAEYTARTTNYIIDNIQRLGVEDVETRNALITALGTAQTAALRWYQEVGLEHGLLVPPIIEDWEEDELDREQERSAIDVDNSRCEGC